MADETRERLPATIDTALVSLENACHYGEKCLTSAVLDEMYEMRDKANMFANTLIGREDDDIPEYPHAPQMGPDERDEFFCEAREASGTAVEQESLTHEDYHEQTAMLANLRLELLVTSRALSDAQSDAEDAGVSDELVSLRGSLDEIEGYVEGDIESGARRLYDTRLK